MGTKLRPITKAYVVSPPTGARVRTRLRVSPGDEAVLSALGTHLGSVMGRDLAQRCREGRRDARERCASRARRKRAATSASSSRWAGAITRSSEDAWQLGLRNLVADTGSLRARVGTIERRLAVPVAERRGRTRGYANASERYEKQRLLQMLEARLADVEDRLAAGRLSVCRGGRRLARSRHHLDEAGLSLEGWEQRWRAARIFICADGESDKAWGNETIRWHPDEHWLELKLPASLAHMSNRPHGRYRLSWPVSFSHPGGTRWPPRRPPERSATTSPLTPRRTAGTFWFDVPLTPVDTHEPEVPDPRRNGHALPPVLLTTGSDPRALSPAGRVLVVDDSEINQLVARDMLEGLGYAVEVARSGAEAVEAVQSQTYDVILMDCLMPGMDGYEATSRIRGIEGAGRHTPIVAITASAMPGDREKCLQAGMDDYVAKPLEPAALAATVARYQRAGTPR